MVNSRVKISSIVENQLPLFVQEEFPLVSEFLKQYYISLENQGGVTDILQNIDQYVKVDNLANLNDETILLSNVSLFDNSIQVETTYGFPEKYGLIKIDDEIITYTSKTSTSFDGCVRGFSGITSLKNPNDSTELVFSDSNVSSHTSGVIVYNLSVLFLQEFFKKVKTLVTPGFENLTFDSDLNKNVFIKQSKDFYSLKGTDESFKILFGALYGETVKIIKPRDFLLRPSDSQYRIVKDIVIESIEGDPLNLLNKTIYQSKQQGINSAYGSVTNVQSFFENDKRYYVLSIDYDYDKDINVTGSVYGNFSVHPKTKIISDVPINQDFIDVDSTVGFPNSGNLYVIINGIKLPITYTSKSLTQFFGCSGISQQILTEQEILLDVYASNYENADTVVADDLIKFHITGVISDINIAEDSRYFSKGDEIYIQTLGDNLIDQRSKSFLYNSSVDYNLSSFRKEGNDANLKYSFRTYDDNIINVGDTLILSYVAKFPSGFQQTIDRQLDEPVVVTGINIPKREFSVITNYPVVEAYSAKRLLSKAKFAENQEISNKYNANISNSYTDSERNLYISSPSLPSYINELETKEKAISFGGIFDETNILVYKNHGFYTGEAVKYSYTTLDNKITNLEERKYFVEKINDDELKIYNSQIDIYTTKYSNSGKDLSISLYSSNPSEEKTNTLTLYRLADKNIEPSKIIRKFSNPQISSKVEETNPGFIGMFVNGVEILNYKSKDSIYYGQIEKINVIDNGSNYDVINPPALIISDSIGYGATGNISVTGSIERIDIVDQGYDYLETPIITITGGNGLGAVAEAELTSYDHVVNFNASQYKGSINLANDTISFSTYHRFRDYEKVIYETSDQPGVVGLNTSAEYYVEIQNETTIKLYKTFNDASTGINTVGISSFGSGIHSLRSTTKKKKLGSVSIVNSGYNYSNNKNIIYSSGISTFNDSIYSPNHGYNDGEVIEYSYTSTSISGLAATAYYVKKLNENEFRLCEVGIGTTNRDLFYKTNQYVNLLSAPSGQHVFNYPPIQVTISGRTGVSTLTPGNQNAVLHPIFRGSISRVSLASTLDIGLNIGGIGYGAKEIINYSHQPTFNIVQGSGAQLSPIISNGSIIEIIVQNGGSGYNSIPDLEIVGSGQGASLTPIISNGSIVDVVVINGGTGYGAETFISVTSPGSGVSLYAEIQEWKINLYSKENIIPQEGGLIVESLTEDNLQFGSLYLAENLRKLVFSQVFFDGDVKYISDFNNDDILVTKKNHSPIVGWAYDGNPIYGSYGYSDPFVSSSSVIALKSGYILNESIQENKNRPPFKAGFFVNDFTYKEIGDLDIHNGRYCVTPEYPNGVYAYFCPFDPSTSIPQFPFIIGNSFKNLPIEFNFDPNSNEDDIDLNESGWKRNTYHYNLNKKNSNYKFLIQPNLIKEQISKIGSTSSGSVEFVGVKTGGSGYKIGDIISFNNEGTGGFGLFAKVDTIKGESVSSISHSKFDFSNIEFFTDRNFNGTVGLCTSPHGLDYNDILSISGISTTTSGLGDPVTISIVFNDLKLSNNIGSTSSTGIVTYFYVNGNLDFPYVIENDVLGIGSETVKVLSVDKKNSRIKVIRSYNGTVGSSHSISDLVFENSRKFVFENNVGDYVINRESYFNPIETLGLGSSVGVGIGTTIYFSNPGSGITSKYIPTKTLYFENHNFKTGDQLTYSTNGGTAISVSTDGSSSFQLQEQSIVYVAKVSNDLIGISTFRVGLSSTGSFVGVDSSKRTQGTLFLTNVGSGNNHSFKTNYEKTLTGSASKTVATFTTNKNHNLLRGDYISVNVTSGITTTIKVAYNDANRRVVFKPRTYTSSNINVQKNTIEIAGHGYFTGKKIIHTSSSLAGGLENNKIYYVVVVDANTIKLANTYYNATKLIPTVVDITSSSGASGSVYEVNPNIVAYKDQSIKFDLSDSSLSFSQNSQLYSAFVFKFFLDSNFVNELNTANLTKNLEAGLTDAHITLKIDDSIPGKLYYNLLPFNSNRSIEIPEVKKSLIIDTEVLNNNSIDVLYSRYYGNYLISGVTTNTVSYNISGVPENLLYTTSNSKIEYTVNSGLSSGPINTIFISNKGKNYNSLPGIASVITNGGTGSILLPNSSTIGKITSIDIIDYGFDYSADSTIRPLPKLPDNLKVDPLNSIDKINVLFVGKNYTVPPQLKLIDGFTNQVVEDLILEFSLENKIVKILQNTKGIYNSPPRIIPVNNSNGSKIKNIGFNTSTKDVTVTLDVGFLSGFSTSTDFPFSIGDKILIENTSVSAASTGYMPRGYNSENYNYELFTIKSIDPNIGGVNPSIVFNVSDYFSGSNQPGVFNPLKSSGRVVAEKDFPTFSIKLKKNEFFIGEEVESSTNSGGIVQSFDSQNDYLKVSSKGSFVLNDMIVGKSSKSKASISEILSYDANYIVGSSSTVRSGSKEITGFLNENQQRMHDSDYYQYFSYSLKSKVPYDSWNSSVDSLNHTAGFKKFSDLVIESIPNVPSGPCNISSGICTDQNYGNVIATIDLISDVDLNCVYDFDLVTENSKNLDDKIVSDQIKFNSRIIQDYIRASGNVVLKIDDISTLFDSTPREDLFSVVDTFDVNLSKYTKYFIITEDTFFTESKQFDIVSLLHDQSSAFINQYGRVETQNDLGFFDFRIFGSEGQLLFYPTQNSINDYNLSLVKFNINDAVGIGTTNLGNVVKIQSHESSLNIGSASTTIVGIASTYRSSKLIVEITSIDSEYSEIDEITIINDNSNVYFVEYGQLDSSLLTPLSISGIGTYNSYYDGNFVKIDLIPNVGVTTTYNINVLSVSIGSTLSTGIGTHTLSSGKLESNYVSIASSTSPIANTVTSIKSPSRGAYLIASIEDTTNNRYRVCELVAINNFTNTYIADFGNIETVSGIGTFSTSLSGSDMNVEFTPEPNIDVQVRVFVNSVNPVNPGVSMGDIDLESASIEDGYGFYVGRENDVKKSFYLTHTNLPIFHRYFDGSSSQVVDLTNNIVNIPDNFFRTGERITYQYDNYQNSTANAIGIGTTYISVGIGTTDKLPRDLYAVKIDDYSIKLASTAENALKLVPEVLDLSSVGIGTNHKFISYHENNRVLISLDNILQSPLVSTSTTTSTLQDIGYSDTLIKIATIENIFPENLLNINDEIMKVYAVGVGSTNIVRVQRKILGSELKIHSTSSLVSKVEGNYNIVDNTINFIEAPYGPNPIGTITNRPDERDFTGITTYSRFNGRVFMRSSAINSTNDPYSKNYIFDDISNQFSGIKSDFSLKVKGANVGGISTSNAILLINDIFQGPENSNLSSVIGNYYLTETAGITSVFFKGSGVGTSYDINTSDLPIGGIIVSVGSTTGLGYQPLVSAGGTAIVSIAGTIQSISIGNSGSGYRVGVQTVVNVAVTTSSLETPNLEFIGTAAVSNGHIVSVAITNPGSGYTSTNPPLVIFDAPLSYSNIALKYSSSSSGFGTEARVNVVVGQGSSVIDFEIINDGYNYRLGEILTIPTGGTTGIPTDPTKPFNEFRITVDRIYNDKFSGWTVGDLQIFDDFSNEFDGTKKSFQLRLDNVPISIIADKNTNIDLSSTLLVFINDILQVPGDSYVFNGGSVITFSEAPKPADPSLNWGGDTLKIYFYRGTSAVDTADINILETVKVGDDLKIYGDFASLTENDRSVNIINSSDSVITNTYPGPGNTRDEFLVRPVIWCRQTEDRVVNGKVVGKDRQLYEPNIEPTTNIIQNVGIASTTIFVENLRTFFDNEKENASNAFISKLKIISQESKVGAYATAVVSDNGSISYINLINPGIGYTIAPQVIISNPVGLGSTAIVTANISGGSVTGFTTVGFGSNYSSDNPPSVLIESPVVDSEIVENASYEGDFGFISGISTTSIVGIASTAIVFDLYIGNNSFLRDENIVGTSVTISGLQTGYYFTVKNTNVGYGVTSLDESRSIVGVGTTFLDNIYKAVSVSIGNTNVPGIGLTAVLKVSVSVASYNGLTGIGYSGFYGEYSWGRISFPPGSRRTPKSFTINNTNGLVGLQTSPLVKRYNPLRYVGYST